MQTVRTLFGVGPARRSILNGASDFMLQVAQVNQLGSEGFSQLLDNQLKEEQRQRETEHEAKRQQDLKQHATFCTDFARQVGVP
jgi:hypothetical protein